MALSKEEQIKLVNAIPEKMLDKLATVLAIKKGSGKGKMGSGFFSDIGNWLKVNVGPVMADIGKTVLNDILVPMLKKKIEQKISGGGLGLAGSGLGLAGGKKRGKGLKLAGSGVKAPHMVKGSQAAKDHMAKLRAMRKK